MYKELFENKDKMLLKLTKKSYADYVEQFEANHGAVIKGLIAAEDYDQVAHDFANEVKGVFVNRKGKVDGLLQMDLNLFMIEYVFTSLLRFDEEKGKWLISALINAWNEVFNQKMKGYMTYEEVLGSFKTMIFGIPFLSKDND